MIAAVLRVTGEGEVFYRQERVGRNGTSFGLLKFATKLKKSPSIGTGTITLKNDPRVLPFGRFSARRSSTKSPCAQRAQRRHEPGRTPASYPQTSRVLSARGAARDRRVRPGLTGVGLIVFRDEESIRAKLAPVDCSRGDRAPQREARSFRGTSRIAASGST